MKMEFLKKRLKKIPPLYNFARRTRRAATGFFLPLPTIIRADSSLRRLEDLNVVDHLFDEIEKKAESDPGAFRAELGRFYFGIEAMAEEYATIDPFSDEYCSRVVAFQEKIARRTYLVKNEGNSGLDISERVRWQSPYGAPANVIGPYLIAFGYIIKMMDLPIGSRILEIGSGEGAFTYQLAKAGYNVTCVEVSEEAVQITKKATAGLVNERVRIDVISGDVFTAEIKGEYDAILFFESFHHFVEHDRLLRKLAKNLKPNGIFVFAGEPILEESCGYLPYPWGLRVDGESLWQIRKNGWMELGFTRGYFKQLLARHGLSHEQHQCADSHWASATVARKM